MKQLISFSDSAIENPVESTHQIRKKLKLFRAFVKLLKGLKEPIESGEVNQSFRDIGEKFSGLRDAHVRQLMFINLKDTPDNHPYHPIIEQLQELNQAVIKKTEYSMLIEENEFSMFKDILMNYPQFDQYFELSNPDPSLVFDEFSMNYSKSYNAYISAVDSLDSHLLHEWRKRLKDVQYQLELIYGNLNTVIQEHYLKIRELCELLGELNDLDMMNQWILSNRDKLSSDRSLRSKFIDELILKQESLLNNAILGGKDLYSFTPEQFKAKLS